MIDKKEMQVIAALRKNSRTSLAKISKEINVSKSTVFDRIKRQEKKLIQKHTSLIDFQRLGYAARIFIAIKTDIEHRKELQKYFTAHKNINNLFVINGGFDFFADAVFKDAKEMEDFLHELKIKHPIKDMQTHTIIQDIKREAFLEEI